MISNDNLNRKALQELLLYYLKERVNKKNNDIKYLIATNIHEFFIFDAHEFERKFYQNKQLRREFQDFVDGRKTSNKTDFFYTEIATTYIEEVKNVSLRKLRKCSFCVCSLCPSTILSLNVRRAFLNKSKSVVSIATCLYALFKTWFGLSSPIMFGKWVNKIQR